MKNPKKKSSLFWFRNNQISLYNAIKYYPKWWDPKKNTICDPIFINRRCEPLISSSYSPIDFQLPQLKMQLQPTKNTELQIRSKFN